jgi:hypothetical protein
MKVWLQGMLFMMVLLALSGCSPRQFVMERLADGLATQGQSTEEDLDLAREASAFYLKLSESVLREQPGHPALAESVAAGFTQYAYAFVAFEADRVEAQDIKTADNLRKRAARLYRRGHLHAMKALEKSHPDLRMALLNPTVGKLKLSQDEVGLAYWAAAAWGGWISLSKDTPELVADLPLAAHLAHFAWQANPSWGQGSLTGLMATFESARPGGNPAQARAWFDEAITQSGDKSAGPLISKAEGVALPAGDRAGFEALLNQAMAIPLTEGDPLALQNQGMQRRAAWLLEQSADLF